MMMMLMMMMIIIIIIIIIIIKNELSYKTQQRFSVFGTCFNVSNIIIGHYEYTVKIYKMVGIYNYSYTMKLYKFKYS